MGETDHRTISDRGWWVGNELTDGYIRGHRTEKRKLYAKEKIRSLKIWNGFFRAGKQKYSFLIVTHYLIGDFKLIFLVIS
ncbi:hypothetical protein GCM10011571_25370 [Marinithermofilum abyssi]|uniref:Uncharacterized protein n=1 Tax=Marinithermofilum abyssi TaxID=1571185 RepID=A0A8J2YEE0_9BACL|nr:hypothetical protein GCM10011571_25370 [Marinithermofilum abyssi]